ncbi:monocarboxylate transporter 4-like [Amphiura filiformis]|uniref:monocarboxylate transporter 4-like n=1 Tax=Amphiura filiformis TaxID=82378 RepID=UPI003B225B32
MAYIVFPPLFEVLVTYYGFAGALQVISAIMANTCVGGYLLRTPMHKMSQAKHIAETTGPTTGSLKEDTPSYCGFVLKNIAKDFDLSLFSNVQFIFQSIICGFVWGAILAVAVYIIPYATNIGISDIGASFILSTLGISILALRLFPVGYFVDKKMVSAPTLAGVSFLIFGCTTIVMPFLNEFSELMVIAAVLGMTWGIGGNLCTVIAAYSAGSVQKAPGAIAWMYLSIGIGSLVYINGCGTFHLPYIVCGMMVLIMGVIVLADPLMKRWQLRIEEKRQYNTSRTNHMYSSIADTDNSTPV